MSQDSRKFLSFFLPSLLLVVSVCGLLPQRSVASSSPPGLCRVAVSIEAIERVSTLIATDPVEMAEDGTIRRIHFEYQRALVTIRESSSHDDGSLSVSFLDCSALLGKRTYIQLSKKITAPALIGTLLRGTLSLNSGEGLPSYFLE